MTHYAIQPAFDVYATTQGRDLGAVADDVQKIIDAAAKDRPKGALVTLRGQVATMNQAFSGLLFGLVGAIVLIYLLIVVNFQSWLDPFVIITALPAAIAGHRVDAVRHPHDPVGARPDRRHHVHGRGHRQLDPGGLLRPRPAGGDRRSRSSPQRRPASPASARC